MTTLWNVEKDKCVEREKDIALEQYIFYSQTADKISDRRTQSNIFFVTLNSTLITIIGIAGGKDTIIKSGPMLFVVPLVGVLVCFLWWVIVKSYRDINSAKFKVLHEIEDRLPLKLYSYEWHIVKQGDGTKYRPTSHIEMWIPWIFGCMYIFILLIQSIKALYVDR